MEVITMKEGRKKKQGQKKTLQEKRSSVRVPVNMIVKYGMDGNYLFDVSKNIAQGGVFIKTDTPSEVGALLDIHLSLPDSKKKIKTQGKVVWVQKPMKQQERVELLPKLMLKVEQEHISMVS